jgi:hypothetical protein
MTRREFKTAFNHGLTGMNTDSFLKGREAREKPRMDTNEHQFRRLRALSAEERGV